MFALKLDFEIILCCCGRYDQKTDTWTMVSSLSVPRDAVGVCLLGDRLYAVGGYDGQSYLNSVESYDAQNNEWTEVILISSTFCIVLPLSLCSTSGLLNLFFLRFVDFYTLF